MWRTSSHSAFNGDCVEADVLPESWRKSTASEASDCPEVGQVAATGLGATVTVVRDSKDPDGAWLAVTPAAWTAFMHRLKTGPRQA